MADPPTESPVAANFECTFCRRKFTKKEHLKRHERAHTGVKPFKCAICDRSFSRGDVLNRHVKGHKQGSHSRDSPNDQDGQAGLRRFQVPTANGVLEAASSGLGSSLLGVPAPSACSSNSSHLNNNNDGNSCANSENSSTILWPPAARSSNVMVHHDNSSLLWPDSEELFQSLTSAEALAWDSSTPACGPASYLTQDTPYSKLPSNTNRPRYDDNTAAEDGRRAVQTINGLLTNTLFDVTSHVELSDLTPRFLDSSLHMFFTKFVSILPMIHRPTFVYRDCSAPFLLNAIALGSLFLGTEDAAAKGEALWKLAHTAIATSWPDMINYRREHDVCSGVELVSTALLSQIYAALSKNRTLRMTSQTFYGLSMHWAQYCGMYDLGRIEMTEIPSEHDPIETKTQAWRLWAARETQLRTLLGLCVVDGVVSQFSGNLVNTWPATNLLPLAADENAFAAETVDGWIRCMASSRASGNMLPTRFCDLYHSLFSGTPLTTSRVDPGLGLLSVKTLLEILSSIARNFDTASQGPAGVQSKLRAIRALSCLRQHIAHSGSLTAPDRAIGLLRWHAVCLDLVVSTARGVRRMCHHFNIPQHIFGGKKRQEARVNPQAWTQGFPARKCLLHALQIHKIASEIPLGVAHDVCLPGALFAAATTYTSFALPGIFKVLVPSSVDWEAVLLLGLDEAQSMAVPSAADEVSDTIAFLRGGSKGRAGGWVTRNLVYELSSIRILLHSLSQNWRVTQEMEEVVGAWEARCSG